jgi:hypothetical protein
MAQRRIWSTASDELSQLVMSPMPTPLKIATGVAVLDGQNQEQNPIQNH